MKKKERKDDSKMYCPHCGSILVVVLKGTDYYICKHCKKLLWERTQ